MKRLTKAEEQIMLVLWKMGRAFVKEVIAELPAPKPAYNTVSTVVRVLEQKRFVGHTAYGRTYQYYPLISQEEYSKAELDKMVKDHFGGSAKRMLSFFVDQESLSLDELDEVLRTLKSKEE
jgi:predicted transcriptional regulator